MKFYSTNKHAPLATLREAVLSGLALDGGLYMPTELSHLPLSFFENLSEQSFSSVAFRVAEKIFRNDIPTAVLEQIVGEAFDFPVLLVSLAPNLLVLELFHGPTLAFKDFAARFLARLMGYLVQHQDKEITILVATSGDTGSAVASGFFQVPGIRVIILYPSGKVSFLQEKQLTTMGGNITALEIDGTFDDCQRLVKQALLDSDVTKKFRLASANSINIARLFPQSFYYFYAYTQLKNHSAPVIFSVPSGNFGNLTAGLIAKKIGLPISHFIAATNTNSVVPEYLATGEFMPRPSVATMSNAMDVGNPSNFVRMLELYQGDVRAMRRDVVGFSFSDAETKQAMLEVYQKYHYILDPHGAVAYAGLTKYQAANPDVIGIFLETAHPAKFNQMVEDTLGITVEIPDRLEAYAQRSKQTLFLPNSFTELKEFLFSKI